MTQYDLILDVLSPEPQGILGAKYGDTNRSIRFHLRRGLEKYPLGPGLRAIFTALKPDGTVLYNTCQIQGEDILYPFTPQTTSCPGSVACELRLYWAEVLLTSPRFTLEVEDTVYHEGDTLDSTSEATALKGIWVEAQTLLESIRSSLAAGEFQGEPGPKGDKGDKGEKGDPGATPHVGENGNWFIRETDTGIYAGGDAVKFVTQELTEAQQIQARKNIDAKPSDVCVTVANGIASLNALQIQAQRVAGRRVYLWNGGKTFEWRKAEGGGSGGSNGAGTGEAREYFQSQQVENGKLVCYTAVIDETGAGTITTETVTGGSGSGAAPDWAQNDPAAPGYIQNRTHWEEAYAGGEVLAQTNVVNGTAMLPFTSIGLVLGRAYKVTWNGTVYGCVAEAFTEGNLSGIGLGSDYGMTGNDLPFNILDYGDSTAIQARGTTEACACAIEAEPGENVHYLDPKYIKDMYYEESNGTMQIMPETALTATPPEPWAYDADDSVWVATSPVASEDIAAGDTVTVACDGTDYTCVAVAGTELGLPGGAALGNIELLKGTGDTGEPFIILLLTAEEAAQLGGHAMVMSLNGAASMTLSLAKGGIVIHKIPERFLPNRVYRLMPSDMGAFPKEEFEKGMRDFVAGKATVFLCGLRVADVQLPTDSENMRYTVHMARDPVTAMTFRYREDFSGYITYNNFPRGVPSIPTSGLVLLNGDLDEVGRIHTDPNTGTIRIVGTGAAGLDFTLRPIPDFTTADNGKMLGIAEGKLAWVAPAAAAEHLIWHGSVTLDGTQADLENPFLLAAGQKYRVVIGDYSYTGIGMTGGVLGNAVLVGNPGELGGEDNGEPFFLLCDKSSDGSLYSLLGFDESLAGTKLVKVYLVETA